MMSMLTHLLTLIILFFPINAEERIIGTVHCNKQDEENKSCKVHCGRNINKMCSFITVSQYGVNSYPKHLQGYHLDCLDDDYCKLQCTTYTKDCKIHGTERLEMIKDIGGFGLGNMERNGYIQKALRIDDFLDQKLRSN